MAVQVTAWVFAHAPKDLKPSEMLVALVLADHANPEGGLAYPSVGRICRMTRLAERTVQGALRSLTAKGVIKRHMAANGPRPDVYCFPAFRGAEFAGVNEEARGAESAGVDVNATPAKNDILPPQILRKSGTTLLKEPSREPLSPRRPPKGAVGGSDPADDQAFERFWDDVIRKEPSRALAREKWDKARKKASAHDIHAGLLRWIEVWEQIEDATKIPHITTWLHQERWTVEHPTAPGTDPVRREREPVAPVAPPSPEELEARRRRQREQAEADEAARAAYEEQALADAEADPQRPPTIRAERWASLPTDVRHKYAMTR